MSAKFSAATERALVRHRNGESITSAARCEGIAYNTLWLAIKRFNGFPPKRSVTQNALRDTKLLREAGLAFQEAFNIADSYAMQNKEYIEKHGTQAKTIIAKYENLFVNINAPRGRPKLSKPR